MNLELNWKMRWALITALIAVSALSYLRATEDPVENKASTYQISDAERLQLSQLESQIWRARYAAETAQQALANALSALKSNCEASGGQFNTDPNQPASSTCVPRQGPSEASPESATSQQASPGPEAQKEPQ